MSRLHESDLGTTAGWEFFGINTELVGVIETSSREAFFYRIGDRSKRAFTLEHPKSGKDWFVKFENLRRLYLNAQATTDSKSAKFWHSNDDEQIPILKNVDSSTRKQIVTAIVAYLKNIKFDFSPFSYKAMVTRLQRVKAEFEILTDDDLAVHAQLKETVAFLQEHRSLFPLPVGSAWADQDGRIQLVAIRWHDHKELAEPRAIHRVKRYFRLKNDRLEPLPAPAQLLPELTLENDSVVFNCAGRKNVWKRVSPQRKFDLSRNLVSQRVVFGKETDERWIAYRAYYFEGTSTYVYLERNGWFEPFAKDTGKAYVGVGPVAQSSQMKEVEIVSTYSIRLNDGADAIELGNRQTLLLSKDGKSAQLFYWKEGHLQSVAGERLSQSELEEDLGVKAQRPQLCHK